MADNSANKTTVNGGHSVKLNGAQPVTNGFAKINITVNRNHEKDPANDGIAKPKTTIGPKVAIDLEWKRVSTLHIHDLFREDNNGPLILMF